MRYRTIICGGQNPIYGYVRVFNLRRKYLPLIKKKVLQAQIMYLGELVWINIDPNDILTD